MRTVIAFVRSTGSLALLGGAIAVVGVTVPTLAQTETPVLVGWLIAGSTSLVTEVPTKKPSAGEAEIWRDTGSNALSIAISPPAFLAARSSSDQGAIRVQLSFRASDSVADLVSVFVPLFHSRHFILLNHNVDVEQRVIRLELSADRLGLDLLSATLLSEPGLSGVALLKPTRALRLTGRAYGLGSPLLTVWRFPVRGKRTRLALRSEVEFPVKIFSMSCGSSVRLVNLVLRPYRDELLPQKCDGGVDPSAIRMSIGVARTVPAEFWQRYGR